jgi:hypothetical protein
VQEVIEKILRWPVTWFFNRIRILTIFLPYGILVIAKVKELMVGGLNNQPGNNQGLQLFFFLSRAIVQ